MKYRQKGERKVSVVVVTDFRRAATLEFLRTHVPPFEEVFPGEDPAGTGPPREACLPWHFGGDVVQWPTGHSETVAEAYTVALARWVALRVGHRAYLPHKVWAAAPRGHVQRAPVVYVERPREAWPVLRDRWWREWVVGSWRSYLVDALGLVHPAEQKVRVRPHFVREAEAFNAVMRPVLARLELAWQRTDLHRDPLAAEPDGDRGEPADPRWLVPDLEG